MPGKHNAGGCGCCGCAEERCSCEDSGGAEFCFPIIELNISGVVANPAFCAFCEEWFNEDKQFDCLNSVGSPGPSGFSLDPFDASDDDYVTWYLVDSMTTGPSIEYCAPNTPDVRQKFCYIGIVRRPEVTKIGVMAFVDSAGNINGQSYTIEFPRVASEDYPCPPFSGTDATTPALEENDISDTFAPCITKDMVIDITWIG